MNNSLFVIERARAEDAAALLDYLKIVGGETENLSFGAEGVSLDLEAEQNYLRMQSESTDNVQYLAKVKDEIIGTAQTQANEPPWGIRDQPEKSMVGTWCGFCSDGSNSCFCKGE